MDGTELLTVEETAGYLRVAKGTVWRWCRAGKLPAVKIGHQWRIRRRELAEMIRPHRRASEKTVAVPLMNSSDIERRDRGDGTALHPVGR